jgi:hypothetical protein
VSDASATTEDPKSQLSYRLARAAVIILGVLLVIALVLLVVGLAFRMTHGRAENASAPAIYTLAPGARIVSMESQPGRLILRVRSPAGDEVDIVDTESGRLVSQVKTAGPAPK